MGVDVWRILRNLGSFIQTQDNDMYVYPLSFICSFSLRTNLLLAARVNHNVMVRSCSQKLVKILNSSRYISQLSKLNVAKTNQWIQTWSRAENISNSNPRPEDTTDEQIEQLQAFSLRYHNIQAQIKKRQKCFNNMRKLCSDNSAGSVIINTICSFHIDNLHQIKTV